MRYSPGQKTLFDCNCSGLLNFHPRSHAALLFPSTLWPRHLEAPTEAAVSQTPQKLNSSTTSLHHHMLWESSRAWVQYVHHFLCSYYYVLSLQTKVLRWERTGGILLITVLLRITMLSGSYLPQSTLSDWLTEWTNEWMNDKHPCFYLATHVTSAIITHTTLPDKLPLSCLLKCPSAII